MNEQTSISVLNNIQQKLSIKRQRIDNQLTIFLQDATLANLQAYKLLVSDFISFAVTQIYLSGLKNHWTDLASVNLYDEVNAVDEHLNAINQNILDEKKANLADDCKQIAKLLDKFTNIQA